MSLRASLITGILGGIVVYAVYYVVGTHIPGARYAAFCGTFAINALIMRVLHR